MKNIRENEIFTRESRTTSNKKEKEKKSTFTSLRGVWKDKGSVRTRRQLCKELTNEREIC